MVSYFHGQLPAAPAVWLDAGRHGHWRAAMTHGVAYEVGKDDIEAAAVHPCGQPGGHLSAHTGPAPRPQTAADSVRDIGFIGHELRGTSIEPGDLDEVLDQPVEVEHLCRTSRAAVAASPVRPGCSWSMPTTAVIAVSGVRSSWDTSLANCRARAAICSSSPTLSSKAEAIALNEATS